MIVTAYVASPEEIVEYSPPLLSSPLRKLSAISSAVSFSPRNTLTILPSALKRKAFPFEPVTLSGLSSNLPPCPPPLRSAEIEVETDSSCEFTR